LLGGYEVGKAKIHMIGNTHIDPVWLWKRVEGMQEVKSSFSSVLERMNEFPNFIFTMSSISYLDWVKHNCPSLFEKIKLRVEEGRWEIAGAMWVEPDCLLPSGESLIRHFLYSKKFLSENFNMESVVGYNVDSFGHGANLPNILKGCGMKYYIYNRPVRKIIELPPVFQWVSPDGSNVIAERMGGEYLAWTKPGIEYNLRESNEILETYGYDRMAVFYGVGNHGGGPTIDNIKSIYELREESDYNLDFSTLKDFFETIDRDNISKLSGELGRIFTGCYSTDNEIKRLNRKAEWLLIKAEAVGAIAAKLSDNTYCYPAYDMEKAWKMALFNQFHDILSGTSIEPARNDACEDFAYSISVARSTIADAVQAIANSIDTRGDGFPLVLINPTGNAYRGVYYAEIYAPAAHRKQVRIRDTNGEEIPYVLTSEPEYARDSRKGILFEAEIPAMGYSVYRLLQEGPAVEVIEDLMKGEDNTLSNGMVSITIDSMTGCPSSIIKQGIELLSNSISFCVFQDDRGTWGDKYLEENLLGSFQARSIKVIERNFLRVVLRSILIYNHSELVVDYVLEKGSDILKINCKIHNHEKHVQICYCMPICGRHHVVTTETAFLAEQRVANDGTEYYQHRFADVINEEQQGIAVFNNNAYGMSQKDNEYRLIISRSSMFARGDNGPIDNSPEKRFMDQGSWGFDLELLPHTEALTNKQLFEKADFMHMPIELLGDNNHEGSHWSRRGSVFRVTGKGIHVCCFKLSEKDHNNQVIRLVETEGELQDGTIHMDDLEFPIQLSPYQVKTVILANGNLEECNMIENEIELR
jgi:alpha-mannosidase